MPLSTDVSQASGDTHAETSCDRPSDTHVGIAVWPRETILPSEVPTSFTDIFRGVPVEHASHGKIGVAVVRRSLPVGVLRGRR